jgi:hypothetical protein
VITLQEPYAKRPVRFLELCTVGAWRLKVYGIRHRGGDVPDPALVARAKTILLPHLPLVDANCYGLGFIGVHQGRGADFVFLGWWANENELFYHVYVAAHAASDDWQYANSTGPMACTWDMALITHERAAWVEHVLANPAGPNVEAYLSERLNAAV